MQNLNIDDGFKEFTINNDKNKVIRFNPSDFNIISRIDEAYKEIDKATNIENDIELNPDGSPIEQLGQAAEIVRGIDDAIKKQIDYIFDSPVSEVVFGNQSPFGMVNGVPYYERFLRTVVPVIKKEVKKEQEASSKRISKYTSQVK